MIAVVAPEQLRPLDRVLVNGGFWTLLGARRHRSLWKLKLEADAGTNVDTLTIERSEESRLTVDRSES